MLALRQARLVAKHDDRLHRVGDFGSEAVQKRDESGLNEEDAVAGMVDDIGKLLDIEARVYGVAYRADPRHRIVDLEMPPRVPCQRADRVAEADAELCKRIGEPLGLGLGVGIAVAMEAALDIVGHDLRPAVIFGGEIDQGRDQHRPVHDQSEHRCYSSRRLAPPVFIAAAGGERERCDVPA